MKFRHLSFAYRMAALTLFLTLTIGAGLTQANGRAKLVSSQEAGLYRVDFSILPAQPVVGGTHVSILLRSLEDNQVVTQATVTLLATGPAGSTTLGPLEAGHQFSPQFFETNLPFDVVGPWQVLVTVASSRGEASITVLLDVVEGVSEINGILVAAVGVAALALGIWTFDRVRGKRPKLAARSGGDRG